MIPYCTFYHENFHFISDSHSHYRFSVVVSIGIINRQTGSYFLNARLTIVLQYMLPNLQANVVARYVYFMHDRTSPNFSIAVRVKIFMHLMKIGGRYSGGLMNGHHDRLILILLATVPYGVDKRIRLSRKSKHKTRTN